MNTTLLNLKGTYSIKKLILMLIIAYRKILSFNLKDSIRASKLGKNKEGNP